MTIGHDIFSTNNRRGKEKALALFKASSVQIVRHVKVAGRNSAYDPNLIKYWENRATEYGKIIFAANSKNDLIAKRQGNKCPVCGENIHNGEPLHLHHIIQVNIGGTDKLENLVWMHEACHKVTHTKKSKKDKT